MKLVYFAWVREQVGLSEEEIDLPTGVETVGDLLDHLSTRGEGYTFFAEAGSLRAAINQEHVERDAPIADAREIAIFPPMTGG